MYATSVAVTDPVAAAVAASDLAIVLTDVNQPDNPLVYANAAFERLTGYSADEVVGRNLRFMQGADTATHAVEEMRAAVREGRELSLDILNYRKDGRAFWNAVYMSPVRDGSGRVVNFFGTLLDTTERKRAQLALLDANDALEAAVEVRTRALTEMLAEKSALLHEVDHRVKNNLQLISSLIKLQVRSTKDPQAAEALGDLHRRVAAIGAVHRHLFVDDDVERFDVADFLRDLVEERGGAKAIELDGSAFDSVRMASAKAAPLALIVGEMLTWAFGGEDPKALRLAVERRDGQFHITVEGRRESRPVDDFGVQVVELLAKQLSGDARFHEIGDVRRARLSLPAESARP